jgi:hypothetical protein
MSLLRRPLLALTAVYTFGTAAVHLREWSDTYRDIPHAVPGSAVVRVGFPINAGVALALAVGLLVTAVKASGLGRWVQAATALFLVTSLAALVLSRTGSLFGWMEHGWSTGAKETAAVEVAALLCLALTMFVDRVRQPGIWL